VPQWFRWGRRAPKSFGGTSDFPGREVAVLRLVADLREHSDFQNDDLHQVVGTLEEHMPELQSDFTNLVLQHLGSRYVGGRVVMREGSIILLAPVHSVTEGILYYVGLRQALEWLMQDFRSVVRRWFRRHTGASMTIAHAVVVPQPPLEEAEISAMSHGGRAHDQLLVYLIASHAVLLAAILAAGAVLLAHTV
jgi:hypothetical protein